MQPYAERGMRRRSGEAHERLETHVLSARRDVSRELFETFEEER